VGLRGQVQTAVITAFNAIGDIARPATYQSLTGVITRDLVAGTSTAEVVPYTLKRTVFTKFKDKEINDSIVVETDEKFLFPALDLPVQPKTDDTILDEHGRTWEIISRLSDPASAVVILQVRTSR